MEPSVEFAKKFMEDNSKDSIMVCTKTDFLQFIIDYNKIVHKETTDIINRQFKSIKE